MMIYLFSGPVRAGKTTALYDWIADKTQVGGFLCPDVDGTRKLYEISTGRCYPFQADGPGGPADIRIGRFAFSAAGFALAGKIIDWSLARQPQWLVIDEIGKLELSDAGFAGLVKKVLLAHRSHDFTGDLLLVVRDFYLQQVIAHFDIQPYRTIGLDQIRGKTPWPYTARL